MWMMMMMWLMMMMMLMLMMMVMEPAAKDRGEVGEAGQTSSSEAEADVERGVLCTLHYAVDTSGFVLTRYHCNLTN
jgi:hypothetical protein